MPWFGNINKSKELATLRGEADDLREQLADAQARLADAEQRNQAMDLLVQQREGQLNALMEMQNKELKRCLGDIQGALAGAVQAAKAAAKNGSGYADVYALVQMGRAVRGAEWVESK